MRHYRESGTASRLQMLIFVILFVVLILLIMSRNSEKARWVDYGNGLLLDAGAGTSVTGVGDTTINATPVPTPKETPNLPEVDIYSWQFVIASDEKNVGNYTPDVIQYGDTVHYFHKEAVESLDALLQAATDVGFSPYIYTAYRPYSTQEYIFNGAASQIAWGDVYTYEEAVEIARKTVAYPGTSDHQTGLGVDLWHAAYGSLNEESMDDDFILWFRENSWVYGFVQRYPPGKSSKTGWDEPWHFRYVGVEAAEFMVENNLCLEEFVELYE